MADGILIHYSRDELLNSKKEYNANCLTRIVVEEDRFQEKKREREEELKEVQEKKQWEDFRLLHRRAEKRVRQDEDDIWIPEGKKPRLDKSSEEEVELGAWLEMTEGRCMRAGKLKSLLKKDQERMTRRMETLEEDQLLESLGTWWSTVLIIPKEQLLGGEVADLKGDQRGLGIP